MDRDKISEIEKLVEEKLGRYGAHGLHTHVENVYKLCLILAKDEQNVDLEVLKIAALLHDIARIDEYLDKTGKVDHATLGAEKAEKILRDLGYDEKTIEAVKHCIETHRFRTTKKPETIEAKILSDADKLAVIGALGIARSFMIAGKYGQQIYRDIPIDRYIKENIREDGKIIDITKHAPNLEFELKFKEIQGRLYTEKAREIAKNKLKFMKEFFESLRRELSLNR